MSEVTQIDATEGTIVAPLSVEEHMANFARALTEVDEQVSVYRDHRSDLKKRYKDNGWLSTKQQQNVAKALRMAKKAETIGELETAYDVISGMLGDI